MTTDPSRAPGAPAQGGAALDLAALADELHAARGALGGTVTLRWRVGPERHRALLEAPFGAYSASLSTPVTDEITLLGVPVVWDLAHPERLRLEARVGDLWIIVDTAGPRPGGGWRYTVAEPLRGDQHERD